MRIIVALLLLTLAGAARAGDIDDQAARAKKAMQAFLTLAKDSARTGQPPRETDAAAKPLLDTVFDTRILTPGRLFTNAEITPGNEWSFAVVRVGLVYILAGTGITDISKITNDPKIGQQADRNTVTFAPEMGRYMDAQLRVAAAMVGGLNKHLAANPDDLKKPQVQSGLEKIRAGTAQTISGVLVTMVNPGLTDSWRRDRLAVLNILAPHAAKMLTKEQSARLRQTAGEVAGMLNDAGVKAALETFMAAFSA